MLITLKRNDYNEQFVNHLVNDVFKPQLRPYCYNIRITQFSKEFGINAPDAFRKLIDNIIIEHTSNDYIITISDDMFDDRHSYKDLDRLFQYGNRSVKGFDIMNTISNMIFKEKIDLLYNLYYNGGDVNGY